LALDGQGGADYFADYAQWEMVGKSRLVPSAPPPPARAAAAASTAAPAPRMTTAERREWKGIEEKIAEAETHVASLEKSLEDPAVASDHMRLQQCWDDLASAKTAVTALYERWAELDAKQG
jgi:ATP-binding cassette subfamily F protein uup